MPTSTATPITATGTVTSEFFHPIDGSGTHTDQVFFFNDTATTEIYTLSLHDALPIYSYVAVYSGDSNYNGSTGAVEPLTINKANSSTATTILDANTNIAHI